MPREPVNQSRKAHIRGCTDKSGRQTKEGDILELPQLLSVHRGPTGSIRKVGSHVLKSEGFTNFQPSMLQPATHSLTVSVHKVSLHFFGSESY